MDNEVEKEDELLTEENTSFPLDKSSGDSGGVAGRFFAFFARAFKPKKKNCSHKNKKNTRVG